MPPSTPENQLTLSDLCSLERHRPKPGLFSHPTQIDSNQNHCLHGDRSASISILFLLSIMVPFALTFVACSSPEQRPQGPPEIPVVAHQITAEDIEDTLPLVGSLAAKESVTLKTEISGKIEEISFKEGTRVTAGEILVKIDSQKLQAEVDEAEANFNLALANLKRSQVLFQRKTISVQERDQAAATHAAAKASLERVRDRFREATVTAPFDGVLGARLISPGAFVQEGDELTTLVSIDPVKVNFEVPEKYSSNLFLGQKIEVSFVAYPSERFVGTIYFVSPELNSDTRTLLVKASMPNPEAKLKPGMFANIDLRLRTIENALAVPDSAIMLEQDKVFVFVIQKDNSVQKVPISIEKIIRGRVIVSGTNIKPGDRIVAQGTQKLFPGASVSIK